MDILLQIQVYLGFLSSLPSPSPFSILTLALTSLHTLDYTYPTTTKMEKARPSTDSVTMWKRSFHDDSDTVSEDSDRGLIVDDVPRRWQTKNVKGYQAYLRVAFEAVLLTAVVILAALLMTVDARYRSLYPTGGQRGYGPQRKFLPTLHMRLKQRRILNMYELMRWTVPKKVVTFGKDAGFGPDLVYADFEMLRNATHNREVHENWQALYPSQSLFPLHGSTQTAYGDDADMRLMDRISRLRHCRQGQR